MFVVFALVAATLEFASWAIWSVFPITRPVELRDEASPVYAGVPWAKEFWREELSRRAANGNYVPFRLWGVKDWHGKYINNDAGVGGFWRRTANPANCGASHSMTVWTFGGSTMYGTAAPDWATIPSYLSHDLNAAFQSCVIVSNYGVEGYVSDQEVILLADQLKAGGHPDIVILYDGVNDSLMAWPPSGPPLPHFAFEKIKNRVEGSLSGRLDFLKESYAARLAQQGWVRLHAAKSYGPLIAAAQPNVIAVLDNYEANMKLVRALGEVYKFKPYCFWQPIVTYGHKPLVPFEQQMVARDTSGTSAKSAWFLTGVAVYRNAERDAARDGQFIFLGGVFDSTADPLYADEAHLGPRGNEIVAQAIAGYIQDHRDH